MIAIIVGAIGPGSSMTISRKKGRLNKQAAQV
jgi:hypothetical protein